MSVAMEASPSASSRQTGEYRLDRDFIVTGWSAGMEEMFGWTAAEAIGLNAIELLKRHDGTEASRAADRAELATTGKFQGLVALRDRDGHAFSAWLEAHRTRAGYIATLLVPDEFRRMDRLTAVEDDRRQVRQTFEQRLRDARGDTTQAELAKQVGVRPNEINRWEHASTWGVLPSPFNRRRLARALEVDDPLYLWPDLEP